MTREPCKSCKSTSHGTKWCPSSPKCYEKNCERPSHPQTRGKPISYKNMDSRRSQRHPSLKDSKGGKDKFVKSQRLVGKVHRVQTKAPKHQPSSNDSEDDSNSSIGSDSSMSVEGTHLEERHKQLQERQEGIPPSKRVNYPLREKVQTPLREERQRQARRK